MKLHQIHRFSETFGINEEALREIMSLSLTEETINEFGRYDALKATLDMDKAKAYFEKVSGTSLSVFKVRSKFDILLRQFILSGGFDL